MIVSDHPQFDTQDDDGIGNGIPPIPEWQLDPATVDDEILGLAGFDIDPTVRNVFVRLRYVFRSAQRIPISTTKLHDLACFVIHRLLLSEPDTADSQSSSHSLTECVRYGIILYMFLVQGTTYFSHAVMLNALVARFMEHVRLLESTRRLCGSFDVWCLTIGMAASARTEYYSCFLERSHTLTAFLRLGGWDDVFFHMGAVLWLEAPQSEHPFRTHWEALFKSNHPRDVMLPASPSVIDVTYPYSSLNSWATREGI